MNVQKEYQKFRKLALSLIAKGHTSYSAKAINELLLYNSDEPHQKVNSYTALLSRIFIKEFPQHKDFFKIKPSYFDCVDIEINNGIVKLKIPSNDVKLLQELQKNQTL